MPIVNINTLQNNVGNSDYLSTYTDVYLKQSLANLGQRFNVKGDGITSDSFPVSDVFNEYLGDIDSSHIVKVSYNYTDGDINMYLCTYNDANSTVQIMKNVGTSTPIDYVDNIVELKDDYQISDVSSINNNDYYQKGALIIKSNDYYTTSAVGMKKNSEGDVIQEYVCDKLKIVQNSSTAELVEGLRIIKANEYFEKDTDTQSLLMIHIWKNDVADKNKAGYVVDLYTPNYSDISGYDTIENYVNEIILPIYNSSSSKTFISPSYIKNVLAPQSANSDDFYGWSLIKRYSEGNLQQYNLPAVPNSITFNDEQNQYWKISDSYSTIELTTTTTSGKIEKNNININEVINYFAADVTTWYSSIQTTFNNMLYVNDGNDTNLKLKKHIFGSLVKKLFSDWIKQESTVTENLNVYNIYMPADFRIYYNCNDNDTSVIYNSIKNITVRFEPNIIDKITSIIGEDHQQYILADTSESKVAIYNFTITYVDNDTDTNIINEIQWVCEYILPYVNDNGYWCINDEVTDIFALGIDAGNPNIILAYSDALTYSVVSGVESEVLQSWEWERNKVRIDHLDRDNNLGEGFYYELNAYLPSSEVINNLSPNQFSLISNVLVVNFLSPETETYPERYKTTYFVDESKVEYTDVTYDPTTAKYVKYTYNHYNPALYNRSFDKSGGEEIPVWWRSKIQAKEWIVTAESGDGIMSQEYASNTYRDPYSIEHEGWQFSYMYTYKAGLYQRNWLRNRPFGYIGSYDTDPLNAGAYIENGETKYIYDKVFIEENLVYSYWWPIQYTADYSNAYSYIPEINKDSLEYKLGYNGVITTFWTLTKNTEKNAYEWAYIKKPNSSFALDTNYINNLDNNIRYYLNHEYQPDNYDHRWVVFTPTNRLLKNNTIDESTYIYPVVKNKTRDEFISLFGEPKGENIKETQDEIYYNDLNFEVAFYDTIKRDNVGNIIDGGVGQSSDRYWKGTAYDFHRLDVISDDDISSTTYGMLIFDNNMTIAYHYSENGITPTRSYTGVDAVIKYSLYPNEWVPNGKYNPNDDTYTYQYPTLELKEVLLRDVNTVNRLNVLSFDHHENTGNASYMIYNAYFGTSYETPDKNVLIVGTSYRNINLGTDTFTTYESTQNLAPHNVLQLNVDNIELNGYASTNKDFTANGAIWQRIDRYMPWSGETVSIYSTIVQPVDIAYYLGVDIENLTTITDTDYRYTNTENSTINTTVHNTYANPDEKTNKELAVLSYNNYLLSYLNRTKNTQTRYFNSRYMNNETVNGDPNLELSYTQTLSYLNVTRLLSDYCSIEVDSYSYIYGDAQALYSIDTYSNHKRKLENGKLTWTEADIIADSEFFDTKASEYAIEHSTLTYYLNLSSNLASDENLVFSYSSPKWNIITDTDGNKRVTYAPLDEDGKEILNEDGTFTYQYNTYRYVATNPIVVTYANYSYARAMDYNDQKYVYAFTYATSYFMEYKCPGCSLCSSATCKYIEHCKWSEIVGYFNIGTCWSPIQIFDKKKDPDAKQHAEEFYDKLISYSWKDEQENQQPNSTYWKDEQENQQPNSTYWKDSYMLTTTLSKGEINYSYTYDVRKISYTCWTHEKDNIRMKQVPDQYYESYNKARGVYNPSVWFFEDANAKDANDKPLIDAHGNPLRVAFTDYGIERLSYTDRRYGIAYYIGSTDHTKEYELYRESKYDDITPGVKFTVANSYYCHVPVSYYDPVRNLKDTYLMVKNAPESFDNSFGAYLWPNAPEDQLVKSNGKYVPLYYSTEERNLSYTGSYDKTPNLLVAQYTPTFGPVNNETTDRRGWDPTYVTNMYGERASGSHYVTYYDINQNGKIDEEDYLIYKSRIDIPQYKGYSSNELKKIRDIIDLNNTETTYTCYFTYLGDFIETAYAYLSYKCINVRELITPHSTPYFTNGDLLSTNMPYHAIVDKHTYSWNFDNESRSDTINDLKVATIRHTYNYQDINDLTVTKNVVISATEHTVKTPIEDTDKP